MRFGPSVSRSRSSTHNSVPDATKVRGGGRGPSIRDHLIWDSRPKYLVVVVFVGRAFLYEWVAGVVLRVNHFCDHLPFDPEDGPDRPAEDLDNLEE